MDWVALLAKSEFPMRDFSSGNALKSIARRESVADLCPTMVMIPVPQPDRPNQLVSFWQCYAPCHARLRLAFLLNLLDKSNRLLNCVDQGAIVF